MGDSRVSPSLLSRLNGPWHRRSLLVFLLPSRPEAAAMRCGCALRASPGPA